MPFRSDNAKEYVSKIFAGLLEDEGVSSQLSVEYTSQQNGVAERANRTLVEMARCMLMQSMTLWAKAINTAAFLKNRCPTKALQGKTPLEMCIGTKLDVSFLHTFGCKAFALQERPGVTKLVPKGHEFVMILSQRRTACGSEIPERSSRVAMSDSLKTWTLKMKVMQNLSKCLCRMEGIIADEHLTEVQTKMEPSQQPIDSMSRDLK